LVNFKTLFGFTIFKFKTLSFKVFQIQNIRLEDCHALWGRMSAILHEFQGFKDFKDSGILRIQGFKDFEDSGQLGSWL